SIPRPAVFPDFERRNWETGAQYFYRGRLLLLFLVATTSLPPDTMLLLGEGVISSQEMLHTQPVSGLGPSRLSPPPFLCTEIASGATAAGCCACCPWHCHPGAAGGSTATPSATLWDAGRGVDCRKRKVRTSRDTGLQQENTRAARAAAERSRTSLWRLAMGEYMALSTGSLLPSSETAVND
ncbi:hypothetical protein EV426DRAFT_672917, partial [Tirmania nivea]